MLASLRLTWRLQRWALAVLIGGPLLLAAACAFVAWQLQTTTDQLTRCFASSNGGEISASCRSAIDWGNVMTALKPSLEGATTVAPFLAGILLGAPLVAGEIEHRTAPLAWSLSLSRTRWLIGRAVPVLILFGLALIILGQASEALIRAAPPGEPGFRNFGMHGPILAAEGLAAFGIGLLVGLVIGRTLPAILTTGLLVIALLVGVQVLRGQLMRAEAIWIDAEATNDTVQMVYDTGFRDDATGELVTSDEAASRFPEIFGPTGLESPPGMTTVYLATPPDRYPFFVAREIGILCGIFVLAAGLVLLRARSRRPE